MRKTVILLVVLMLMVAGSFKAGSAHPSAPAGSLLDALPDGSGVVVLDFQKISGSSLWTALNSQEKFKVGIDKVQSEMTDLGLKLSDVHTVALGFAAGGMNDPTVAVAGGFQQTDLLARLQASTKLKVTSEKYKNFVVYRVRSVPVPTTSQKSPATRRTVEGDGVDDKSGSWFVFHDSSTLVVGTLNAVRASVDVRSGARPSISQNARLAEALSQDPGAAVRFALALTPDMTGGLKELPLPEFSSISLVFGTIELASGIDVNATLRSDSVEHAKMIAEKLNALLTMGKGFLGSMTDPKLVAISEALKTVSVTTTEADVKITGNLPMELLNSLLSSTAKKGN